MSETQSNPTSLGVFPEQIISEILTRLPVKSTCRFKSVSKRWLSLISSPYFLTSYISLSSPSWAILDRFIRVTQNPEKPILDLPLNGPPAVNFLSISTHFADPFEPTRGNFPAIISTKNGLFLFAASKGKRDPYEEQKKNPNFFSHETEEQILVVCNPITRQWFVLPKPGTPFSHRGAIGFTTIRVDPNPKNGFVVKRFLVVEYQPIIGSQMGFLRMFDSKTEKWVTKSGNYMLGMHFWRSEGTFEFDGCLFWKDLSCGLIFWDYKDYIFNGKKKKKEVECGFISLPKGCRKPFNTPDLENKRCIGVGGGECIQFMEVFKCVLRLYRLKDYKGKKEWDLVYKVSMNSIWCDESFLGCGVPKEVPSPKFFHPFERDVTFLVVGDKIFAVNVGTKKVVSCCGVYSTTLVGDQMVVAPFVIPSWPTSLPPVLAAASEKDLGNEYFVEEKFDEAIRCYSKSITYSPTAVAYVNRATAYLYTSKYMQAETDCTKALMLDAQYMNAYARRAIARKDMGQLRAAKEDAEFALKMMPHQNYSYIPQLYADIMSLLEKETTKGDGDEDGVAPSCDPVE